MTKEDIYKAVYELMSDAYKCDGSNSPERTLGEIMGIMSLAEKVEDMLLETDAEPPEHDGCKNCKHSRKNEWEEPCIKCKQNFKDKWEKWEKRDE